MKTLKLLPSILTVVIFAALVGCSDEMISPSSPQAVTITPTQGVVSEIPHVPSTHFESKLTLKNGESVAFGKYNTGIALFKAIRISNCDDVKRVLDITGSIGDIAFQLNCNSKGFSATQIIIQNISGKEFDADVQFDGDVEIRVPPGEKQTVNE